MVLIIAAIAFVVVITVLHSTWGFFSGLLNAFCAVFAMTLAFGFFEWAQKLILGIGMPVNYAAPSALLGIYVLSLTVLRILADTQVRGNVRIPAWLDWAGGAACGFVIAQVSVGVLVLSFLMLPFGSRVAMFERFPRHPENEVDTETELVLFERRDIPLFKPDVFATSLFSFMSSGSLKGTKTFGSVYPDFVSWVAWTGNTVQEESDTSPRTGDGAEDGFKDGLRLITWWEPEGKIDGRYRIEVPSHENPDPRYFRKEFAPQQGHKLIAARIELHPGAAEGPKNSRSHRFRSTMIRLVGELNGRSVDYPARLLLGADPKIQGDARVADFDNNFNVPANGNPQIDVMFEVAEGFTPRFVEYRRFARTNVDMAVAEAPPPPLGETGAGAQPTAQAETQTPTGRGTMRFIDALVVSRSGGIDDIPFQLGQNKATRAPDLELEGNRIRRGRISGTRTSLERERDEGEVKQFWVPEGVRMFQFTTRPRDAQSMAGDVFNFVAATANTYRAVDKSGNEYRCIGYYATVKRGGADFFELYYSGSATQGEDGWNGLLDFKAIEKRELTSEGAELTLLFLVPPGTRIVRVENQVGQGVEGFELGA